MAGRYQLRELHAERGGVATHEGVDPLTGLPVLVYRFSGNPATGLRDLESENIPGLLGIDSSDSEDDKTEVVVAYFKEYQPLEPPLAVSVATLLMDSARALKDAAQAGVVHGDIYPGRFLASRDHVLLEGFGVPWQAQNHAYRAPEAESSFAGDVYAWAKSVLELAEGRLDGATLSLVTSCLSADPDARPAASELYAALKAPKLEPKPPIPSFADAELTFPAETTPPPDAAYATADATADATAELVTEPTPTSAGDAPLAEQPPAEPIPSLPPTTVAFDFSDAAADEKLPSTTPPAEVPARTTLPAPQPSVAWDDRWDDEGDPELILSDPGDRYRAQAAATPKPATKTEPFVKNLPPGATYRPGETNTGLRPGIIQEYSFDVQPAADPRRRRLIIMLLLLVFGAAILAYLALFWQQRQAEVAATPLGTGEAYIVDAAIGPPDLPPTDIYVVSSPAGSRNPPGALIKIMSPPGQQIAFDRAGTWQLQARFEKRASEIVTFQVPQQHTISFTVPPEPVGTP